MQAIQESQNETESYNEPISAMMGVIKRAQDAEAQARELRGQLTELRGHINANSAILRQAKQTFVDGLNLGELFGDLKDVDEEVFNKVQQRLALNEAINQAKKQIEEIKALKIVNGEIDGKNEAERNARMTVLLSHDAEYLEAKGKLESAEAEQSRLDAEIEAARNQVTAIRYSIRAKTAILEFLAAE